MAQMPVLAQHLGWSDFKEILYLGNELARQFYAEMCRLMVECPHAADRVRGMMFERWLWGSTAGLLPATARRAP
jgi:hypothetical protein